jgi:ribosomal protein S18 acetylase RimI-like enzyme
LTSGTFVIRPATEHDEPGLLECLHHAFERYQSEYTPDAFADTVLTPELLRERLRTMHVLVAATESEAIVGTLAFQLTVDEGHLRGMAVAPEYQGLGIAQQLLRRALQSLGEAGCRRVTLDTTAPLERAAAFYQRQGFQKTGRVIDFFGMPLTEWAKTLVARDLFTGRTRRTNIR